MTARRDTLTELLTVPVAQAAATLDWIETRQGQLKSDGYARIETTVDVVRRLHAVLLAVETDQP